MRPGVRRRGREPSRRAPGECGEAAPLGDPDQGDGIHRVCAVVKEEGHRVAGVIDGAGCGIRLHRVLRKGLREDRTSRREAEGIPRLVVCGNVLSALHPQLFRQGACAAHLAAGRKTVQRIPGGCRTVRLPLRPAPRLQGPDPLVNFCSLYI